MTTIEDVYHPHERNRWFYEKEEELEVCPINIVDDISGHIISKEKTVNENLKIKHYIKIGEECPLCYEPIWFKRDAFLTDCGHSFHLSCIHSYDMANIYNNGNLGVWCPMCRSDMGLYGDSGRIYFNSSKGLDKLEDFWSNIQYKIPRLCLHPTEQFHIIGLKKTCFVCVDYRKTGYVDFRKFRYCYT